MAMVQVESYNFATVENPLSDGGNFTIISDVDFTGSLKVIAGNLCEQTTANSPGGAFWSGSVPAPSNAWPADQYTELTLTSWNVAATVSGAYLVVRQGVFNSGTQYILTLTGGNYILYAVVGGTAHSLQTAATTIAQGDVWRLSVTGNVLSWTRNGSAVSSFTDTNNYIASGAPGFGLNNASAIADTQTALWAAGANQAATPTFSPVAGSYTGTQTITITSASGGTIYYTEDGTTPTHASSSIASGGTISLAASATVKAVASATNFVDSAVGSAAYTITPASSGGQTGLQLAMDASLRNSGLRH